MIEGQKLRRAMLLDLKLDDDEEEEAEDQDDDTFCEDEDEDYEDDDTCFDESEELEERDDNMNRSHKRNYTDNDQIDSDYSKTKKRVKCGDDDANPSYEPQENDKDIIETMLELSVETAKDYTEMLKTIIKSKEHRSYCRDEGNAFMEMNLAKVSDVVRPYVEQKQREVMERTVDYRAIT
ncbi:hypothetical protein HDU97_002677 [Phlyctochytrium planicorne]|nr:hypothetical protein HDU97_002677 [Phlyctochytrium planicorne]